MAAAGSDISNDDVVWAAVVQQLGGGLTGGTSMLGLPDRNDYHLLSLGRTHLRQSTDIFSSQTSEDRQHTSNSPWAEGF